jgi:hypothetical protein
MTSSSSPTCNFTLQSALDLGVSFQSSYGGANWGGQITIFAPTGSGPVTTGLWDSDGNLFFTIYLSSDPSVSCTINSAADPVSSAPLVSVGSEAGLSCAIGGPVKNPDGSYNFTLSVSESGGLAKAPGPRYVATMVLPHGGMKAWTEIMQGQAPVPNEINPGSPVVMAWARFDDGTQVAGGVYKWEAPSEYNVKFMWVLDASGNQYAGWPIDVSDDEDFYSTGYSFSLIPGGEADYLLNIVENSKR